MKNDESQRPVKVVPLAPGRSHFIVRAMEWDDPKAKYPNIWLDGMPRQLLVVERIARRLRLGDLIATYHPASQRHPARADRVVGISRVAALRGADQQGVAWIELETAFRFAPPFKLEPAPRRVFLCCDPGWPDSEVALFRQVYDAAVAAGWQPGTDELFHEVEQERATPAKAGNAAPTGRPDVAQEATPTIRPGVAQEAAPTARRDVEQEVAPTARPGVAQDVAPIAGQDVVQRAHGPETADRVEAPAPKTAGADAPPADAAAENRAPVRGAAEQDRKFAGVNYSGDMRDPRSGTWLAVLGLAGDRLRVLRVAAIGRHGLEARLRDPDPLLTQAEAIGLDFPFALPQAFAESLLDGPFPDEGWWALARRMERLTRPEYLTRVQEFRETHGEVQRLADERAEMGSPLGRSGRDLCPMTFHGVRMIGEDRSRFAVRPFETAQGKLLLEVRPETRVRAVLKALGKTSPAERLAALARLPVDAGDHGKPLRERGALAAVLAARCAAKAVLGGEADKTAEELAPGQGARVLCEGWIYGLDPSDP